MTLNWQKLSKTPNSIMLMKCITRAPGKLESTCKKINKINENDQNGVRNFKKQVTMNLTT